MNGVSSSAPIYSALSTIMLLLCGLFLSAWMLIVLVTIALKFPAVAQCLHRASNGVSVLSAASGNQAAVGVGSAVTGGHPAGGSTVVNPLHTHRRSVLQTVATAMLTSPLLLSQMGTSGSTARLGPIGTASPTSEPMVVRSSSAHRSVGRAPPPPPHPVDNSVVSANPLYKSINNRSVQDCENLAECGSLRLLFP